MKYTGPLCTAFVTSFKAIIISKFKKILRAQKTLLLTLQSISYELFSSHRHILYVNFVS